MSQRGPPGHGTAGCLNVSDVSKGSLQDPGWLVVSMSPPCLPGLPGAASIQSIGEHPEHQKKRGIGLGCGKATKKKLDRQNFNRGQPLPANPTHSVHAGTMQGSLVGIRVLGIQAPRWFGT